MSDVITQRNAQWDQLPELFKKNMDRPTWDLAFQSGWNGGLQEAAGNSPTTKTSTAIKVPGRIYPMNDGTGRYTVTRSSGGSMTGSYEDCAAWLGVVYATGEPQ